MNDSEFIKNNELEQRHWWFRAVEPCCAPCLTVCNFLRMHGFSKPVAGPVAIYPCWENSVRWMPWNIIRWRLILPKPIIHHSLSVRELPDEIPYSDEAYDLVCAFDVLEHVEEDGKAVAALARKLKPGGVLLCTAPANQWMWSQHDVINQHYRRYSLSSFQPCFGQ